VDVSTFGRPLLRAAVAFNLLLMDDDRVSSADRRRAGVSRFEESGVRHSLPAMVFDRHRPGVLGRLTNGPRRHGPL